MPVARFAVCLLLAVCAHAATAFDLLGRYGPPIMQRFAAGPGIVVSVEYDKDGHVATVEIAPVGYKRRESSLDLTMDRGTTSELIDYFVPRDRQQGMLNDLNCLSSMSRKAGAASGRISCSLTQGDQDIAIQRSYTITGNSERERVATITSKTGLPQTAITLEGRCGAAVAERFAVTPGIALTATYDAARAATEIVIAPLRPMLDAADEAQVMPAADVDRILDEIAPVWTRTGTPGDGSMQSGCNEIRIEEFEKLSITRSFHHCRLPTEDLVMQAVVRWGPRRMMPEAGKK